MNEWEWQLLEDKTHVDHMMIGEKEVRVGNRVRLLPRKGGDVLDIALAGQVALIESIEQDYEGKNHICVVLENDPGRDLGFMRQPGHRFFFDATEIEPVPEDTPAKAATQKPTVLVACIGNIFFGDDGFGVEVAKRLGLSELPTGVKVVDFGIRGFDLVCALQEQYDAIILVDAYQRGLQPGSVSLIEPDLTQFTDADPAVVEGHSMNPLNVLRMAAAMGMDLKQKKIMLVGCEPFTLGGEEGYMGLSEPVATAVDEAARMTVLLAEKIVLEKSDEASQDKRGQIT